MNALGAVALGAPIGAQYVSPTSCFSNSSASFNGSIVCDYLSAWRLHDFLMLT